MSKAQELKAQLEQVNAARKARLDAAAEAKEVARLEQTLKDNKAIDEAEQKLGEQGVHIVCLGTPDGRVVIFKRAEYAMFREYQEKKDPGTEELEALAEACRHYPDAKEFDEIVEEFPGMLAPMTKAILKLAGALQEEASKK